MAISKRGRISGAGSPGIFLASASSSIASACLTAPDKSMGVSGQTWQILDSIHELIQQCGGDPGRMLMVQVWLLDIDDIADFASVWNEWIGEAEPPALSVVQAPAARSDCLVEIRAYAAMT